jgi:alpha-mannosidase
MHFLDKRIEVICKELKKLSVVQCKKMDKWKFKKGNFLQPKEAEESKSEWLDFDSNTMHWYGPDEHYWFKTVLSIPEEFQNKAIFLNVKTQIDEWDDAKNPQFLLFVNGEIVQGIDMNHRTVKICDKGHVGQEFLIELQAYTGILHTEFSLITELQEISSEIESLYYDLQVPLWAFPRIKDEKLIKDLETILNHTINLLDLRIPYSQDFYQSIDKAKIYIQKALYENMSGYEEIIASCIGHTHIDVAWWWTVEQTREKVARSFATVLKLMEEYPDYKFMSSQPQLYAFLKKRYPELYKKVKERIQEGRWEVEGGMWVEADCNLSSGESLVRQFLHGKKFFKEEFGKDNEVLWLPDVFGYSGALPQIMKKSGIKYFMTTKLAWNQFNKIPNDTFLWKGIDGSKILTHFITTLGVGQPIKDFFTTYNGTLHPDSIMGGWERYQNKEINHDILISYGYGDGGGGPTKEMLETSLRMEKGIKGIPKVRQEFAGVYFRELEQRVEHNPRLNTWEGELYFEYHRGTLTSMARNKRDNRLSELRLMDLELLSVMALEKGFIYPERELQELWENVLLNQFHDILPGSSIREVYEVTKE